MTNRQKSISVLVFILILSLACAPLDFAQRILGAMAPTSTVTPTPTFTPTPMDTTTDIWYVNLDGHNDNTCASPADACATLAGAIRKSTPADQIFIAEGVYPELSNYIGLIGHNLTISGAGESLTILDGEGIKAGIRTYGAVEVRIEGLTIQNTKIGAPYACIHAGDTSHVTLEDVTVRNCKREGLRTDSGARMTTDNVTVDHAVDEDTNPDFTLNGNGILNYGEMELNNSFVINNERSGIVNQGSMVINGTEIRGNARQGIDVFRGNITMYSSLITGNGAFNGFGQAVMMRGGVMEAFDTIFDANLQFGISVQEGALLRLTDSEITNHAGFALAVRPGGTAELLQTDIENNGTGADELFTIINEGNLTMAESSLSNNVHLGLYNIGNGTMFIYDTVIANQTDIAVNNQDATGEVLLSRVLVTQTGSSTEAVYNGGTMRVINSTISNNSGDGLHGRGDTTLLYVTIAENSGVGLVLDSTGPYEIRNSIMAKNTGGDCNETLSLSAATLGGTNIDTDSSCGVTTYTPTVLALDGLADNGGLTMTHALLDGSPAIEAASGVCPTTDQRGFSFTRPFGPACDVGAFEASAAPLSGAYEEIMLIIETDTACYTGPGPNWPLVNYMDAGTQMQIIGIGLDKNWMVASHPTNIGTKCWVHKDDISFEIPVAELRIIAIPPKPAPEPTKTPEPRPKQPDQPDQPSCNPNDQFCTPQP